LAVGTIQLAMPIQSKPPHQPMTVTKTTPVADVATTPTLSQSKSNSAMRDLYSNEGSSPSMSRPRPRMPGETAQQEVTPTIGKAPVIAARSDADLRDYDIWIPAPPRGLPSGEIERQLMKDVFRRNGLPPSAAGRDGLVDQAYPVTKRMVNGQEQTGYDIRLSAGTQASMLRADNRFLTMPGTRVVIGDAEYQKMVASAKQPKNPYVPDKEWRTGDVGMDNILERSSRLVSSATRLANGEQNPELLDYYKTKSAELRQGVAGSNAAANVNSVVDDLDKMVNASQPNLGQTALSAGTLGLMNVAGDNNRLGLVQVQNVEGLPERAANELRANGASEESVDGVKGVMNSFVAMRKTAGTDAYEGHRLAFENGLKSPAVTAVLSKGEIDWMRKAAAPTQARDVVGGALPRELIPRGEQLINDIRGLKDALGARNGHSFNTWATTSLERNQAETMIKRLPALEAAMAAARKGDASQLNTMLNSDDFKMKGGPKNLQTFLDETDKAGMRNIEWFNDVAKAVMPPGMKLTVTAAWEMVKYGRGDNKTLEATALAIFADAVPDLLGMDKLPGGGKQIAKTVIAKGGGVFAANMAPALANIGKQVYDGSMSPRQAVSALQGEIAKAAGKSFVEMGGGVMGGMLKQLSPSVREAVMDKVVGLVKAGVDTPTVKDFMQAYADAVK
jgi:hypothetical protein